MKLIGWIVLMTVPAFAQPVEDVRQKSREAEEAQLQAKQSELKAQLARLAESLEEMRKAATDNHPDVVRAKEQLEQLRAAEAQLRAAQTALRAQDVRSGAAPYYSALGLSQDRWWRNAATVQALMITADQQKKMDDVFQQFRLKLIDSNASLQKAEVTLEPLMAAEPLDQAKIAAQIDRVADARADLEKTNGRMLLGLRQVLTPAQWSKLNTSNPALPLAAPLRNTR